MDASTINTAKIHRSSLDNNSRLIPT